VKNRPVLGTAGGKETPYQASSTSGFLAMPGEVPENVVLGQRAAREDFLQVDTETSLKCKTLINNQGEVSPIRGMLPRRPG